ncbi:MAG: selenocysteine-specific translation elongation factor [Chthonomonadales bacterium]|nr:selenocysteine-specific translation elongation factor [Chthonomonadales bacterium]
MRHLIVGTAGHVDHGKSALVKALTGTDPDRFLEEQVRGMTIDLGYASLRVDDAVHLGVIDVPGHERFLKNMLAGAVAVDIALLVVAADEGVMPQTVDHIISLHLLGIRTGLIAITKSQGQDAEWLEVVASEVRDACRRTFLADAPIVFVDSISGAGVGILRRELADAAARTPDRRLDLPPRFQVDSAFIAPGRGIVARGTLLQGSVRSGDILRLFPRDLPARIRGLQSHGESLEHAVAGMRLGINVAGLEVDDVTRGSTLAGPGSVIATSRIAAALQPTEAGREILKDRDQIRLHHGGSETIGRLRIHQNDQVQSGDVMHLEIRLNQPIACVAGDRFIVRRYSPMEILGGGTIVDPAPPRRGLATAIRSALDARATGSADAIVSDWLKRTAGGGDIATISAATGLTVPDIEAALGGLIDRQSVVRLVRAKRYIATSELDANTKAAVDALSAYHSSYPLRKGMPRAELLSTLPIPRLPASDRDRYLQDLVAHWAAAATMIMDGPIVRLPDFEVALNAKQEALVSRIVAAIEQHYVAAPKVEELARQIGVPRQAVEALLPVALDRGDILKIASGIYLGHRSIDRLKGVITEEIRRTGTITAGRLRDLTGSSRKHIVPILEYLDSVRFTRRQGDIRVLEEAPVDAR